MLRSPGDEPISIADKTKRLKSLDEFEPPYWLGLFSAKRSRFWPLVLSAVVAGAVLGWFVF